MEDPKQQPQAVSAHDMALSNMLGIEALMRVLIQKGVITEQEVLAELETVNRLWTEAQEQQQKKG